MSARGSSIEAMWQVLRGWWLALPILLYAGSAAADVRAAYQREFAFLLAEKEALTKRLADSEAESQPKLDAAKAELDGLQGRALGLSLQADRMMDRLADAERSADSATEDTDIVDGLLAQAAVSLEASSIKLPESSDEDRAAKQLEFVFTQSLAMLDTYSQVRKQKGEFFGAKGERISGDLLKLGRIATFGLSEHAAGALAPAGAGRLKLWPVDTDSVARTLATGEAPPVLKIFLHESLEKGVEAKKDKTAVEVVQSGGAIGWVIVGAGALALLMALARALLLWRAAANTEQLVEGITPLLEEKKFEEAIERCRGARSASGRVLVATLSNLGRDRVELDDIISEAVLHEQPTLDRFGSLIIVVAAVAPLLGLLGTVTGMIATFDIITEFGTGNPKLLSGGIAIALVTTELGLIVAIPALVVGNLLSSWAEGIKDGIDKAALRVVNISVGIRVPERPQVAPEPPQDSGDVDPSRVVPAT